MKTFPLRLTLAGLTLALGTALALPGRPGGDDLARQRAFLEWEEGTWDARITMPGPAGEVTFRGVQTDHLGCCGQWLITDLVLTEGPDGAAPPPYEGHGVLGVDPAKKALVGVWLDGNTNWLATAEGSVSADGHTLTLAVEGRDPATGAPLSLEYVTTRVGDDERRLEVFAPGPGGRVRVARIESTRRAR